MRSLDIKKVSTYEYYDACSKQLHVARENIFKNGARYVSIKYVLIINEK